ncbi:MAG: methyltransferase domain-containing protein [Pseudomonadota bacterium]
MLPRETVIAAYRWLLGRMPEDAAAITYHQSFADEDALRLALLTSPEFRARFEALDMAEIEGAPGDVLPLPQGVATALSAAEEAALWARIAAAWARLGETEPHWSVLTVEGFRAARRAEDAAAHAAAFAASADFDLGLVEAALARAPDLDPAAASCLELGCGVGRVTAGLARRFRSVAAFDISAPHLAEAEAALAAEGLGNVAFTRLTAPGDLAGDAEPIDLFFSRLVLQHNPPALQARLLGAALARLAPGGLALFQVLSHLEGYRDGADPGGGDDGMELHPLPQPAVFALLAEAGLTPLEVQSDLAGGADRRLRTHLFLARRPRRAP